MQLFEPAEVMKRLNEKITGSKYFTWGEALWMRDSGAYALPTAVQIHNIVNLAQALDKVREHYGRPIQILSWLRTPAHNALVKGALKSTHLDGIAVDFIIPGLNIFTIQDELMKNKQIWPYRGERGVSWVHLDMRGDVWFYP